MTKQEAEQEAIRRFYLLPEHDRLTYEQAEAYAMRLGYELEFPSIMAPERLIAAWLIREVTNNLRMERDLRAIAEASAEVEVEVEETVAAEAA